MREYNTIVIGAGPAGLFAALHIRTGSVLILERKSLPGRKLMIAGSGRCNITHTGNTGDFFSHYGENSKFLRPSIHSLTNLDLIHFFNNRGLPTISDKNGKVFPITEKSADVLNVLIRECHLKNVLIHSDERVVNARKDINSFHITTETEAYSCSHLLIATGGMSYPSTGSSGDGYEFARKFGHSIITPLPSLSPVFVRSFSMAELAGVSVQDKTISLFRDTKKIKEHRGDIGFTHKGLSGPGILDFSRFMKAGDELRVNFPDLHPDVLRQTIIDASEKSGKTFVMGFLRAYDLPRNLVKIIMGELGIDTGLTMANMTKDLRAKLVSAFCEYPFLIEKVGGFNVAMATHGGVSTNEVSSRTMESKLVTRLYFAGEVLDIDGDSGGYNLQAAFSTGYLAASSINHLTVMV